ncbi:MAG: 50S ribosomal protein L29 [Thermofilum sp.]
MSLGKSVLSAEEVRKMTPEERQKKLIELRAELARLTAQVDRGALEKPSSIRKIKRAIAIILTVEREEALKGRSR